jgi:hypothetical protein
MESAFRFSLLFEHDPRIASGAGFFWIMLYRLPNSRSMSASFNST